MEPRLDILLVDDDHNDLALFGIAVDKSDLNIWLQTAIDGEHAIDYLEGRGVYKDRSMHPVPDLVVLDLAMRLSSGFDFLDWRRASRTFSSLPVIIFSGLAYKGAVDTALEMGAKRFLAKPVQLEGWNEAVRQIWDLGLECRRTVAGL